MKITKLNIYMASYASATIESDDHTTVEITITDKALVNKTMDERYALIIERCNKYMECASCKEEMKEEIVLPEVIQFANAELNSDWISGIFPEEGTFKAEISQCDVIGYRLVIAWTEGFESYTYYYDSEEEATFELRLFKKKFKVI